LSYLHLTLSIGISASEFQLLQAVAHHRDCRKPDGHQQEPSRNSKSAFKNFSFGDDKMSWEKKKPHRGQCIGEKGRFVTETYLTASANGKSVLSGLTDSPLPGLLFRFRRWIVAGLVLLWLATVTASHIPQENLPPLPVDGKVLHVLGFFGLATVFELVLAAYGMRAPRRNLIVLLALSAYAAFDEGTQPYFHRHGSVWDWLLDTSSAATALVFWQVTLMALKRLAEPEHNSRHMQQKINSYLNAVPSLNVHAGENAQSGDDTGKKAA
jgi:VanZ family protein